MVEHRRTVDEQVDEKTRRFLTECCVADGRKFNGNNEEINDCRDPFSVSTLEKQLVSPWNCSDLQRTKKQNNNSDPPRKKQLTLEKNEIEIEIKNKQHFSSSSSFITVET